MLFFFFYLKVSPEVFFIGFYHCKPPICTNISIFLGGNLVQIAWGSRISYTKRAKWSSSWKNNSIPASSTVVKSNFLWTKFRNEVPNIYICKLLWNRTRSRLSTSPCYMTSFGHIFLSFWSGIPWNLDFQCLSAHEQTFMSFENSIEFFALLLSLRSLCCSCFVLLFPNYFSFNLSHTVLVRIKFSNVRPNTLLLYSRRLLIFIKFC
jgi:hypothetical protein